MGGVRPSWMTFDNHGFTMSSPTDWTSTLLARDRLVTNLPMAVPKLGLLILQFSKFAPQTDIFTWEWYGIVWNNHDDSAVWGPGPMFKRCHE
jgi:hypothetical protein